jgi:hypothetical protein
MIVSGPAGYIAHFDCTVDNIDDLITVLEAIRTVHPGCLVGTYEHTQLHLWVNEDKAVEVS